MKNRKKHSASVEQPLVKSGLVFAEDVVAGKVPAGKYTIAACRRQLQDLDRDFDYYFDVEEGERICSIISDLPHTKGKWRGQPIGLEPFQCFIVGTLFGWRHKTTKKRRFMEAYICLPRKQGKSLLAAAIGHILFAFDGENSSEVYCGATNEQQAWEVYKPARQMAMMTPEYVEECGVQVNAKTMVIPDDASVFKPVIGDPGDGSSPSGFVIDEYHEHKTSNMYDTAKTGMGSREQPLLLVITTAGSSIEGPCHQRQRIAQKVLDEVETNERLFSVIFHADAEDDWTSREALHKANPNIDVSVSRDFLYAMQDEAIASSSETNTFKTKHLNLWVSSKTAWLNILKWNDCERPGLRIEDFEGSDAILSIDLSTKWDFTCLMRVFPVDEEALHYYLFPRYYLPEQTIIDDKTGRYQAWHSDGWLTATDGKEVDFKRVRKDAEEDLGRFNILSAPYDPWAAVQLSRELEDAGAPVEKYNNNTGNMSEPMKELESAIYNGRVHHDGNPITTWMISNVVAKSSDGGETIRPVKEGYDNKIDGPVAAIQAIGSYMRLIADEEPENAYEARGARSL